MQQRLFHFFSSLILTIFLVVTLIGLGVGIRMQTYGHFTLCPVEHGKSVYCLMEIVGTIEAWQKIFTATLAEASLSVLAVAAVIFLGKFFSRGLAAGQLLAGYKKYGTVSSFFSGYNYLRALLAQGIINPKVYA